MKKNPDQSATEFATESATRLQEPKVVAVKQWAEAPRFNISPDGQAMTVLCDALDAELPADGEAIATTVAVLQIPIYLPMPLTETHLGLSVVLRGFLDKPEGVYASLHIELGGVSKTFEYSQDTALNLDLQLITGLQKLASWLHRKITGRSPDRGAVADAESCWAVRSRWFYQAGLAGR